MAWVSVNGVCKEYSGRWVLENVSFEINAGQKVGFIGSNGSGKTTLLRILCGKIKPDAGNITTTHDVRIGYVPQHVDFSEHQTVLDYLLADYHKLKRKLEVKEQAVSLHHNAPNFKHLLIEYEHTREEYDHWGGEHFVTRAKAMLESMGLGGREGQPIQQLSGGEQNVLAMTHALLGQPNLLILDEPGNHLDYKGLAWLDDFLRRFRGALLIVSHNRYLLDRVVGGILELDHGKIQYYPGNYTKYRELRAEKLKSQQHAFESWQSRISQLESLVERFKTMAQSRSHDASWGKRLRARRTQLERERSLAVDKPQLQNRQVNADFQAEPTRANIALQIRGYTKSFGDLALFDKMHWEMGGGQRWALVGPNGSGKTTLLKEIVAEGRWENPIIRIGPTLTIGYCSQQQEILDSDSTVYDELIYLPNTNHEQVLGILARFLFTDEEVYKEVGNLSGGERNRLQLARLMLLKPNFLILDEPTNHLDILTCEAVEAALAEFEGTLLVVSHDRYFLDTVADHVAEVHEKNIRTYQGNFTQYWQARQQDDASEIVGRITTRAKQRQTEEQTTTGEGSKAWEDRKAAAAELRKRQKRAAQLEEQVANAEKRKQQLEADMTAAFSQGDIARGEQLSRDFQEVSRQLERLMEDWLAAQEALEQG